MRRFYWVPTTYVFMEKLEKYLPHTHSYPRPMDIKRNSFLISLNKHTKVIMLPDIQQKVPIQIIWLHCPTWTSTICSGLQCTFSHFHSQTKISSGDGNFIWKQLCRFCSSLQLSVLCNHCWQKIIWKFLERKQVYTICVICKYVTSTTPDATHFSTKK